MATSLRFLHEVLGLERLHYGLWSGEPPTLEGLKAAQARYSELLQSWIPEGVRRILDVGAGVGTDALELARRGYRVEGLSPDPYQRQVFEQRTGLPFHLCRYQEFETEEPYDLVLMSESAQYIWLGALFEKTRELAPGGHLLMADYFLAEEVPAGEAQRGAGHPLPRLRAAAEAAGCRLLREEDLTERVLPTLELGRQWLERYFDPSLAILDDSLAARWPRLWGAGKRLLRRPFGGLARQRELLDAEAFRRRQRYLLMLWRVGT